MRISLAFFALLLLGSSQAFGQNRTWNAGTNDFADHANWTDSTGSFTGVNADWRINLSGASRAEATTAIGNVQRDISVGRGAGGELFVGNSGSLTATRDVYAGSTNASGNGVITVEGTMGVGQDFLVGDALAEGRLFIEGGTVDVTRNMRLGRQGLTDGYGQVTVNGGGTLTVGGGGGLFVGQSNRAQNVFTLNDGTVSVTTTLNVAHNPDLQANLIINGGSLTAANAVFADGNSGTKTATLSVAGGSLTTTSGSIDFGNSDGGANSTVTLSSGSIAAATNVRVGFGSDSVTNFNISGGSLNASTGFITMGQGTDSTTTVTMSGGSINADRLIFANNNATSTLNMTGGSFNLANTGGGQSTAGALVLGSAGAELNIGGNALVNAQKLYINNGGVLNLSGNALLNISGSTDGTNATFDFSSGLLDWDTVNGQINLGTMYTAMLQVAGEDENIAGPVNFVNLFNEAIANNKITHTVAGGVFEVGFNGTHSYVRVVPEPSSLALAGLIGAGLLSRRSRRR